MNDVIAEAKKYLDQIPEVLSDNNMTALIRNLLTHIEKQGEVIERLASMEAFEVSRAVSDSPADKELIARISYAQDFLNNLNNGEEDEIYKKTSTC